MLKRSLIVPLAVLFVFIFSNIAWSTIEGQWYMQVVEKLQITEEGQEAQQFKQTYTEDWEFYGDSTCKIGSIDCTWHMERKKYIAILEEKELKNLLTTAVYREIGREIVIDLLSVTTKIKQKRNGKIKANMKVVATCVFQDNGSTGKLKYMKKYKKLLP